MGASDKRNPAPKSNPRPGTEISKPVFGCELFVAHTKDGTMGVRGNRKLFTAIHKFEGPAGIMAPAKIAHFVCHGQTVQECHGSGKTTRAEARVSARPTRRTIMKAPSKPGLRQFQLKIMSYRYSDYIDQIAGLERVLARKPRAVQINLVGTGEIPADMALLIRSVLQSRSPKTQIITNARSSLQGGAVLVWLLGDRRLIRDDARLYFRRVDLSGDEEADPNEPVREIEPKYRDSYSEVDPEEADYVQVLRRINEFLPVRELAGRMIGVPVLRQFGLVENEQVDHYLATAFGKSGGALVPR
jgi:hypothetical protein